MELQKMSNGHHDLSPDRIPENGYDALEMEQQKMSHGHHDLSPDRSLEYGSWFVDGRHLILIVGVMVILPLALMKRLDLRSGTAVQPTMTRTRSMEKLPPYISSSNGRLADDLQCSSDLSGCVH